MRKFLFSCAFLCAFGAVSVSAQSFDTSLIKKSTYYGLKAGDSEERPCKGLCIFKCAVKENEFVQLPGLSNDASMLSVDDFSGGEKTLVRSVLKDADGNILHESEEIYYGDVQTAIQQFECEEARKGAVVE
jgi:hypothetical protein